MDRTHILRAENHAVGAVALVLFCFAVAGPRRFPKSRMAALVAFFGVLYFFREPCDPLAMPDREEFVTCPTYGTVTHILDRGDKILVSIFLSVLDPHAQYSPVSGTLALREYFPGKFRPAQLFIKTRDNERCECTFVSRRGVVVRVAQIAGFIARRIVAYVPAGQEVSKGEAYGMIRFGSRVDVELPGGYRVAVKVGDKVRGRSTVLATPRQQT